ncbi:Dabb family protein [Gilvimarinus sp. SDUM040013]|uniref:Dabb family protein n=1 Tax=Gilvimarinus gilvus TaxID=3058038 RepID=A0ABU4S274_9GAMM|nr:Dabb family protein [Gilvimarinus sp. SDUM040013]MDO3385488.1 Dabb family protein [Gilvimarinus sp. SDUM040013]MDX6851277.1 Dabb family protein [Gilvimarinus sp. SDUM040013]
MSTSNRRKFLTGAAALGATAALPTTAQAGECDMALPALEHKVFFWLKNPDSTEDRDTLIAGLKALEAIPSVKAIQIGVPASTEKRDVVDNSFQVSELMLFDNVEGQNAYQVHPLHKKFVDECSHLWERVVVFDSIAV